MTAAPTMPNPSTPSLTTGRLLLDALVPADAPALFAYRADPEVARYQSFAPTGLPDAEAFIRDLPATPFGTPDTWFQLAVRRHRRAALIGDLGVHFTADGHQVEVGFTLAPTHQGQGLASEAVTALLDHTLGALGKHRAFASVDPRNAPSLALLERIGMRREAHFRQSLWFKGEWVDDVVYAVLRTEWSARPGVTGAP